MDFMSRLGAEPMHAARFQLHAMPQSHFADHVILNERQRVKHPSTALRIGPHSAGRRCFVAALLSMTIDKRRNPWP
jgi:hypothetical protein